MEKFCHKHDAKAILTFSKRNIRFYRSEDDTEPIFEALKFILDEDYYHHTHADSHSSLNQFLSSSPFDLLVFNLETPEEQDILRKIKTLYPELPIFLLYFPYTLEGEKRQRCLDLCKGSAQIPINWNPIKVRQELVDLLRDKQPTAYQGDLYALS